MTLFASRNSNEPYDPADIDLTAIPKFERYVLNPRVFVDFSDDTEMDFGVSFTTEDRMGGDIHYINGHGDAAHSYFENNESHRISTQFSFTHHLNDRTSIHVKNSTSHFDRLIQIPTSRFDGAQMSTFSEANIVQARERSEWILGANAWTENFSERAQPDATVRDYSQTTFGAFVQNTVKAGEKIHVETGFRADHVVDYGTVLLPRISVLYKANQMFSTRIGGGFGYKAPTIFTEESERIQFQNVLPISSDRNVLEKSYGANWDVNYRTEFGDVGFSINQLFFYTYLDNPLMLMAGGNETYQFVNIAGYTDTRGAETNIKVEYGDFKLFLGYTLTDTKIHEDGRSYQNPLTAKHRLNNVLFYEVEEKWKIGLEAYYFSRQRLSDDTYGREYWICGFMVERLWERFSLFINFENFLDTRQTRLDTIYTGTVTNPQFRDIYAPLDGFVVNGGVKLNL